MAISPISGSAPIVKVTRSEASEDTHGPAGTGFTDAVKKAIGEVNKLQTGADKAAVNLASGDIEDVHKAMLAMNKAKLALDFTIQVRNKVIEAYQEIMRMQV